MLHAEGTWAKPLYESTVPLIVFNIKELKRRVDLGRIE